MAKLAYSKNAKMEQDY